jgi:hypothetical protein
MATFLAPLVIAVPAVLVGLIAPSAAHGAVISPQPAFGAVAFGTSDRLGTLFRSGPSALLPICTTRVGVTRTNDTQGSSNPSLGTLGGVKTRIATRTRPNNGLAAITTSRTAATHLFAGAIAGSAFTAVATAAHNSSGYALSGSTTIQDLRIAGKAMPSHPSVNQTVTLPGIGFVVLNQQSRSRAFGTYRLTVVAARITIGKGNSLGLPTGTIAISSAQSALHASAFRAGSGFAYGSNIQSGRTVRSGRTAPSYLPCGGTNGATTHNSTGAFGAAGLHSAAVHTSTRSTDSAAATTVVTQSAISNLNLLGGAIKASAIVSRAIAKRAGGTLSRSSGGTTISGLTINGQTQSAKQPANTVHAIPGIGTLYVHKVVNSATGVHVYALQLVLSRAQDGLDKGTRITVGATYAAVAASGIG